MKGQLRSRKASYAIVVALYGLVTISGIAFAGMVYLLYAKMREPLQVAWVDATIIAVRSQYLFFPRCTQNDKSLAQCSFSFIQAILHALCARRYRRGSSTKETGRAGPETAGLAIAWFTTTGWISACTLGVVVVLKAFYHGELSPHSQQRLSAANHWIQIGELVLSGAAMSV